MTRTFLRLVTSALFLLVWPTAFAAPNGMKPDSGVMDEAPPEVEAAMKNLCANSGIGLRKKSLEATNCIDCDVRAIAKSETLPLFDKDELAIRELLEKNNLTVAAKTPAAVCGFTPAESLAIAAYTDNAYGLLNDSLRAGGEKAAAVAPFKRALDSALAKLKPYKGIVRRGALLPDDRLAQHQPGAVVTYSGYTSASLGRGFDDKMHTFSIRSKTGRYIAPGSVNPGEFEVLFPANTKFKVIERVPGTLPGSFLFTLEEVE